MPRRLRVRFPSQQFLTLLADRALFVLTGIAATLSKVGSSIWTVGTQTFTEGGGTSDIASTGPSGAVAGGVYTVDVTGTQLPSGMTLSTSGTLSVGSATAQTASGVVFEYTEPGALSTLTLYPTTTGTYPYMATVYPNEGVVPGSRTIVSKDDTSLKCSVLSSWPDGSAQVCVVAGTYTFTATNPVNIGLRVGNASGSNLTTGNITALVSSVALNFGGGVQSLTPTTSNHDFIWWANPQVICARYRRSCGVGSLEAVIDIHAFAAGRAFVEITIENGKFDPSSISTPASQPYVGATVSVNGTTIATVSGTSGPNSTHEAFRAWYCSTWVNGDPGIDVTHDSASLQAHPLFWKQYTAQTFDQTTYGAYSYSPWVNRWHCSSNMGGTGESGINGMTAEQSTWIGPLPAWEAAYIQTGNRLARKAILAAALEALKFNVICRDSVTGLVPTSTAMQGKYQQGGTWPRTTTEPAFEDAHQPAVGLVAFLCLPSPRFIEMAQQIFCWNHTTNTTTGRFYYKQVRARAWSYRNYAHAIFLTPDTTASGATFSTWKSSARSMLGASYADVNLFRTVWNTLNVMYGLSYDTPADDWDHSTVRPRAQRPLWEHYWLSLIANQIDQAHIIRDTVDANGWTDTADWLLTLPVDYVNGCTNGEWRLQNYTTTYGDISGSTVTEAVTWGAMLDSDYTGTPPAETGDFLFADHSTATAWSQATGPSYGYADKFWAALCMARERDIPGASTAYSRVIAALTPAVHTSNLAALPRYNIKPRNV